MNLYYQYALQKIKGDQRPKVYFVLDNCLRWIPNETVYYNLFNAPMKFTTIEQNLVFQLPEGDPLPGDAVLVKYQSSPKVYLIDVINGVKVKRWIVSEQVFNRADFNWSKIQQLPDNMNYLPDGPNIA